jgi:hypothetical protein
MDDVCGCVDLMVEKPILMSLVPITRQNEATESPITGCNALIAPARGPHQRSDR